MPRSLWEPTVGFCHSNGDNPLRFRITKLVWLVSSMSCKESRITWISMVLWGMYIYIVLYNNLWLGPPSTIGQLVSSFVTVWSVWVCNLPFVKHKKSNDLDWFVSCSLPTWISHLGITSFPSSEVWNILHFSDQKKCQQLAQTAHNGSPLLHASILRDSTCGRWWSGCFVQSSIHRILCAPFAAPCVRFKAQKK